MSRDSFAEPLAFDLAGLAVRAHGPLGAAGSPSSRSLSSRMAQTHEIEQSTVHAHSSQRMDQILGVILWVSLLAILILVG